VPGRFIADNDSQKLGYGLTQLGITQNEESDKKVSEFWRRTQLFSRQKKWKKSENHISASIQKIYLNSIPIKFLLWLIILR